MVSSAWLQPGSPNWLTGVLARVGALPTGHVLRIETRPLAALSSSVEQLWIDYSADAPIAAPRSLIMKRNHNHDGMCEAPFYQIVMRLPDSLPMLPRCYTAEYDSVNGESYCLLQDLSNGYAVPGTRAALLALEHVPNERQLEQMVDAIAEFHAYWWQHPLFGSVPEVLEVRPWYRDALTHQAHVERREREWASFQATTGATVPAELQQLCTHALAQLPRLWEQYVAERVGTFRNLTLSNGDCYFAQFLCPTTPENTQAMLLDFQDVSVNFGPYDLVYMFATFWTPAQRNAGERELRLLRRYHAQLLAHGVRGYNWPALLLDYRLMLAYMLFDPIWNQASGSSREYWWPKLQCLAAAYRDWQCNLL